MAILAVEQIDIGLKDKSLEGSVEILNRVLSDLQVLYVKTRNFHWNVTGMQFHSLHELFEKQYTALGAAADEVAEHVRSRGARALGTMEEFLHQAHLKEQPGRPDAHGMIEELVHDHESVIRFLRESVDRTADELHDLTTSDFLTGLMKEHEKMAWMLRSHLES